MACINICVEYHAMLQASGNSWSLQALGRVVVVGMLVSIVPTVALFLFSDDKSLGAVSEGLLASNAGNATTAGTHTTSLLSVMPVLSVCVP